MLLKNTPASDQYVLGAPLFKKISLQLENGRSIKITARNNGADTRYIKAMKVNGKSYSKNWLSHSELLKGAEIDFSMSDIPAKERGIKPADLPYSFSNENW